METEDQSMLPYGYYISYGEVVFSEGTYYEGDKIQWKDMDVPQRPNWTYVWSPNPSRPTPADWQFDGHDADGGYWFEPPTEE